MEGVNEEDQEEKDEERRSQPALFSCARIKPPEIKVRIISEKHNSSLHRSCTIG